MSISKANWSTSGNSVRLNVPFSKVDKNKRTVSGFATLDNIDSHGDVVLAEASVNAFKRFRGNLREMHQPLAVGKVVNFEPKSYYDPKDSKVYQGVYVTSYISKGAPDTWEKVLDGTLSGFSIGGSINDSDVEVRKNNDEDEERSVRIIKDYDLVELSLVDNPANQLANVFSIEKVNGKTVIKGIVSDVIPENIYWCSGDSVAITSTDDSATCDLCAMPMESIGWVESGDTNKAESIKTIVDRYIKKNSDGEELSDVRRESSGDVLGNTANEGGTEVADAEVNVEATEAPAEAVVEETAAEAEAVAETAEAVAEAPEANAEEAVVEKAADVQEVAVEELDVAKKIDELKSFFTETFTKTAADYVAGIDGVRNSVDDLAKSNDARIADIDKKVNEISELVNSLKENMSVTEKRIDAVEADTAIKKSADLGGSKDEQPINKSKWGGTFLGVRNVL